MRVSWTEEQDRYLRANLQSLTYDEIARALGKTRSAISGYAMRNGMGKGIQPRSAHERREANKVRCKRWHAKRRALPSQPPQTAQPVIFRKYTLNENKTCCWPIGEPGTKTYRTCENHPVTGKPYCPEHCAVAFVNWEKETAPVS